MLAFALVATIASNAMACGADTDCMIGARSYRIELPKRSDDATPIGAIIFVHGYRGTSKGVMRNAALTSLASELGVAFVAAQAAGPEWNIPGVPSVDALKAVDEIAYFDSLIGDIVERFHVDPANIVVAGFSSGAMMVWYLACHRGSTIAGFVPMSGTFWQPIPTSCPSGSVNLIHYHGSEDPIVPMHGRKIKDGHQGDIFKAFDLFAVAGDYKRVETTQSEGLQCSRQLNADGRLLELCVFPGKHQLKVEHLRRAWNELRPAIGD